MASRKAFLARNLEDVDVSGADDGDSLVWDAGDSLWQPVAISGGGAAGGDFTDLDDVPVSYATYSGYFVRVKDTEDGLIFDTVAQGGAGVFTDLTDVPNDYTTFSGYAVQVKSTEDGLEFVVPSAGGATSMMAVVNTNWSAIQDAHTEDSTWAYITACSGIITTEEDDGIIRCDWNGVIKYDDSNWEYFYLRFQLDTPDGTVYSPTMTHQFNSGANTTKYNIENIMFVWSGMPAGDYVMRPQVILTSNMNASFYARTGVIRGDWPVEGGGGGGGGASDFTDLSDTPSDYTDDGEKYVKVNVGETALEFVAATIPDELTDLTDTPANYTAASGKYLRVNDDEDAVIFDDVEAGAGTFTSLSDVPSSYSGQAGKHSIVNDAEDALEFVTISGGSWAFEDSTTAQGIDQDRSTGGSFAYQQQYIWIVRPMLLTSVLWDIRIADGYTMTVRDADETVLATVYKASVGAASADEEFALANDIILEPGYYKFRMTPDSTQQWYDKNGDDDYYFNSFSIVYAVDYGGTDYPLYRAPVKLKFYESYTIPGSGYTVLDEFTELDDTPANYATASGYVVKVNDAETGLVFEAESGGGGGGGLLASFRAQITGTFSFPDRDTYYKVPFDVQDFETGTYYDETTNYRWTPPEGICHISLILEFTDVNTSGAFGAIYKNGTILVNSKINRYPESLSTEVWDECNGTDYYEVYAMIGSFSNADIVDSAMTKFQGAVFTAP